MPNVAIGQGVVATDQPSAEAIEEAMGYTPTSQPEIQTATPTTGQTVVMTNDDMNGTLYLKPAGTLAELTVTLPSAAVPGQIRRIATTREITDFTINGATNIYGNATSLAAGDCISYQFMETNTWFQLV